MRIRIHSSEIIRRVGIHFKGRKRKRRHPTCRPWQLWRPETAQGSPPSACLSHPAHPHQQLTLGIKNHIYRYLHKVKTWPKKNCLRQICEQLIKKLKFKKQVFLKNIYIFQNIVGNACHVFAFFKGTVQRDFRPGPLINKFKYFRFQFRFR